MIISEEDFLEHYGVKGMRWGVRRKNLNSRLQDQAKSTDKRTKTGKKVKSLASESQRIKDHGGGLKGTRRLRKEMLKNGELTKKQIRKGNLGLARNVAIGVIGGAAVGAAMGEIGGRTVSSIASLKYSK